MPAGAVLRLAVQLGRLYAFALHGPSEGPVRMTSRRRSRWLNSPAARLKRHQPAACPHGSFRESPGSFGAAPDGRLAQLVERLVYTEDVGSSSLSPPTICSPSDTVTVCNAGCGPSKPSSGSGRNPAHADEAATLEGDVALLADDLRDTLIRRGWCTARGTVAPRAFFYEICAIIRSSRSMASTPASMPGALVGSPRRARAVSASRAA